MDTPNKGNGKVENSVLRKTRGRMEPTWPQTARPTRGTPAMAAGEAAGQAKGLRGQEERDGGRRTDRGAGW